MTSETGGSKKEASTGEAMPVTGMSQGTAQSPGAEAPTQAGPQAEGRRTQLKIVRESVESLSRDIGGFRRSHEASVKKLEKEVAALRSELGAQALSKDVGNLRKVHDANSKKLEKQVATLRNELAAMKSSMAKDAARSRAKQEAMMSKILAKVSAKSSKPAKSTKK